MELSWYYTLHKIQAISGFLGGLSLFFGIVSLSVLLDEPKYANKTLTIVALVLGIILLTIATLIPLPFRFP